MCPGPAERRTQVVAEGDAGGRVLPPGERDMHKIDRRLSELVQAAHVDAKFCVILCDVEGRAQIGHWQLSAVRQ